MVDKIILSILIPTIPEREDMLSNLLHNLLLQIDDLSTWHPTLGEVQLHFDDRASFLNGGPSIGEKRHWLVCHAKGKYLCFLDDDEDIAPNYIETLVRLCQNNSDVVTFRSLAKNDFYWTIIDMSLQNKLNEEANPDRIIKRPPWHVCPVKSEYAKQYNFEDLNYGEDWNWFEKVLRHCRTESHTDAVLHCYQHSSKHSEADKITNHVLAK
jgi:hypothetical protein